MASVWQIQSLIARLVTEHKITRLVHTLGDKDQHAIAACHTHTEKEDSHAPTDVLLGARGLWLTLLQ